MKTKRILSAVVSAALLFTSLFSTAGTGTITASAADVTTETLESSQLLDDLMDTATSFIAVRHYQLGGSHYAYTEYLNEVNGGNADNTNGPELGYYKAGSQPVSYTHLKWINLIMTALVAGLLGFVIVDSFFYQQAFAGGRGMDGIFGLSKMCIRDSYTSSSTVRPVGI